MTPPIENYCCPMRRHFLIGILGHRDEPTPLDAVDFYVDPVNLILAIKFCPFCGKQLDMNQSFRAATMQRPQH
jgi:hypothetical protein